MINFRMNLYQYVSNRINGVVICWVDNKGFLAYHDPTSYDELLDMQHIFLYFWQEYPSICYKYFAWFVAFTATCYNKIFSGYQPHQLVKRRFKDHLRPRPQGWHVWKTSPCHIYIYLPRFHVHDGVLANGCCWFLSGLLHQTGPLIR
jgi:hypothetical protein